MEEILFKLALMTSILLCGLVTGLLFGFAVVAMPGIGQLPDDAFLLAFKHMDGVIQDNQPLFMLVWVGSIVSMLATIILGSLHLTGFLLPLLWAASALYLVGVQAPTARFNIPLNNAVQALEMMTMDDDDFATARTAFEGPWNRWNQIRTLNGILAVSAMVVLLTWLQ